MLGRVPLGRFGTMDEIAARQEPPPHLLKPQPAIDEDAAHFWNLLQALGDVIGDLHRI